MDVGLSPRPQPVRGTSLLPSLFERQPVVARFAVLCFAAAGMALLLSAVDPRTIAGVPVWLKPAKFFLSVGVFTGTMAWFFGYVRPERRRSPAMRMTVAVLLLTACFELAWITWQGARGLPSHFNFDTPFYSAMYSLMGLAALALAGTTLPLAWEIARRPVAGLDPGFRLAVILGLLLTFALGASLGGYISAAGGASVGPHHSAIPLFAWNQIGGDLRVAHFFGIHAQQAIPLYGAALVALRAPARPALVVLGATAYSAVVLGTWLQALGGKPFPLG